MVYMCILHYGLCLKQKDKQVYVRHGMHVHMHVCKFVCHCLATTSFITSYRMGGAKCEVVIWCEGVNGKQISYITLIGVRLPMQLMHLNS